MRIWSQAGPIARAAEAAKIGENPGFARKLAYARDKALLDDYLDQVLAHLPAP